MGKWIRYIAIQPERVCIQKLESFEVIDDDTKVYINGEFACPKNIKELEKKIISFLRDPNATFLDVTDLTAFI